MSDARKAPHETPPLFTWRLVLGLLLGGGAGYATAAGAAPGWAAALALTAALGAAKAAVYWIAFFAYIGGSGEL